jgi:hypothetical protein
MKCTVSFEIEPSRLADLEAFLNGEGGKKGRPKKEDVSEEPIFSDDETEDISFGDTEDAAPSITKKDLLELVKERVNAKKTAALGKLFAAYKIKNVSGLKEDKYENFHKDILKIKV